MGDNAFKNALEEFKLGKRKAKDVADEFGVHRNTVSKYANNIQKTARIRAGGGRLLLDQDEEAVLAAWVRCRQMLGSAPSFAELAEAAKTVVANRPSCSSSVQGGVVPSPSRHWVKRFNKRNGLISRKGSRKEAVRSAAEQNRGKIMQFFDNLKKLHSQHNYSGSTVWNADETGIAFNAAQSRHVVGSPAHPFFKETSNFPHVTLMAASNAGGDYFTPMLIYNSTLIGDNNLPAEGEETIEHLIAATENGWMNSEVFERWLSRFCQHVDATRNAKLSSLRRGSRSYTRASQQHHLLILDGHTSHISVNAISIALASKVDILILPAHMSHKMQALDVAVYKPFKQQVTTRADVLRFHQGRLHKKDVTTVALQAFKGAFTVTNIAGGFRASGCWPINPQMVLRGLPPAASSSTPITDERNQTVPDVQTSGSTTTFSIQRLGGGQARETTVSRASSTSDIVVGVPLEMHDAFVALSQVMANHCRTNPNQGQSLGRTTFSSEILTSSEVQNALTQAREEAARKEARKQQVEREEAPVREILEMYYYLPKGKQITIKVLKLFLSAHGKQWGGVRGVTRRKLFEETLNFIEEMKERNQAFHQFSE